MCFYYKTLNKYKKSLKLWVTYDLPCQFQFRSGIGLLHSDWLCAACSGQSEMMPAPARERWSQENMGSRQGLCCITVAGRGGGGCWFSYLLESHMTYLAGSHVLRSWPGIWFKKLTMSDYLHPLARGPWLKSYLLSSPSDWLPGGGYTMESLSKMNKSTNAVFYKHQNYFSLCLLGPGGVIWWEKPDTKNFIMTLLL